MTRRLGLLIGVLALGSLLLAAGCEKAPDVVKIGYNIELTGDIPKVGEGSKDAAELLKEEINGKGGLQVGDKKYPLEFIYQDNEAKAESATAAALKLITRDKVLAIIGPQASKQAVPAGEVCNANKTPPDEYDVIATLNLNGDYISDALAAVVGGIGIAPGANLSDTVAMFEATHGTAPKYAGKDYVNPGSIILSAEMMLRHMGWIEAADLIIASMEKAISNKKVTYDFARLMDGATEVKCSAFGDAMIACM